MMKADFFYTSIPGRALLKLIQKSGAFRFSAWFLHTQLSRRMIPRFIEENQIDMTPYEGQDFRSYADFFARSWNRPLPEAAPEELISPCDSLMTWYPVEPDLNIPMKGSAYRLSNLIQDPDEAKRFSGGLCLVFRLEASDYHHFCSFDDAVPGETHFIPGELHSVQPIALQSVPVFRLNRRWWTLLRTLHFGTAAQIEVGAMIVGGVTFAETAETGGILKKGAEMGNFELAGSTIILLLEPAVKDRFEFYVPFYDAMGGAKEIRVRMGEPIGRLISREQET